MKRFIDKLRKLMPTKRKIMQLYFALLFNANLKGFVTGNIYKGNTKIACVPGINCYSCPGAIGACPLGSLQGSFSADKSTIFYVGGIILLYCIMFGRMICGWLCPFGLIQELIYKLKTPKLRKSPITRILSYFKYIVLVFFVFIVPITYAFRAIPLPAFCKYICPAGTLEGGIGLLANKVNASYFSMLGPLFTWKFVLFVSITVASIFIFRVFCRFICPLGALYGLFNKISVFGVKVDNSKCTNCNLCVKNCKLDIHKVGDQECISCGECMSVCPTNAIVWKGVFTRNDKTSSDNKKAKLFTRIISAVLLAAILVGSIVYYWNDETNAPAEVVETERGNEIGDLCYEADLDIITGDEITSETVDPTKTGKITIINFWGTWCGPCKMELPYFNQIASDYSENVSVIAVHTNNVAETAPEYIMNNYSESKITFARDLADEGYYTMLGGRGTYPYTVIINAEGIVIEVFYKALTYDDLKNAVESELNK